MQRSLLKVLMHNFLLHSKSVKMEIQREDFLLLLVWSWCSERLSLLNNFSKRSPADSLTEPKAAEKAGRERIQLSAVSALSKNQKQN